MLESALAWHAAGCSVGRASVDGSKAPLGYWKQYQQNRATTTDLQSWFESEHPGIGVFTGGVSGNLEMLEYEGRAIAANIQLKMRADLEQVGHGELWRRITAGYTEQSAGGGLHIFYRVDSPVAGNTKLAERPAYEDELTDEERQKIEKLPNFWPKRTLVETRGEGGFVVVAPSHGPVHSNGRAWEILKGGPGSIATVTADERDLLHAVARSFDEMPAPAPIPERTRDITASSGDLTPGEDFNERGSWSELLEPHGWQVTYVRGDSTFWTRPGKSARLGASAVTGGSQGDYMYVWSTSTELPSEEALSKWRVYAYLEYAGDFSAAAAALRREGYGTDRPLPERSSDGFDGIFGVTTPDLLKKKAETVKSPAEIESQGAGAEGEQAPGGKFLTRLYTREALRHLPRPEPLIEDTLDLGTVAMLVGYWGSMKSFVAIDWAASIATGRSWQGRKVCKPGRVLYIASEGAHGLNDRLESWERGWQSSIESDRFVVLGAAPNLGNRSDVADVCALVAGQQFDYVVVDTLAKCVTGMDENSSRDMGVAVESLYRIRDATREGSVIAVHHTGKDRVTTRGSSAVEAGVDTVYLTEKIAEGSMNLSRTKRKDGPQLDELQLQLSPVEFTESCVLEIQSSGGDAGLERQTDGIMTVYRDCFSATGCSKKELVLATMIPEQHFYRAFNSLLESGRLVNRGSDARPHYVSGE